MYTELWALVYEDEFIGPVLSPLEFTIMAYDKAM